MMREPEAWTAQLRKGVVEIAVLGLLAEQETYGQALVEELGRRPSLEVGAGTVYPLLNRLRKAGLVQTRWQESPAGPPRKYYALTTEGRTTLTAMTAAWAQVSDSVSAILNPKESR